MATFSKRTNGRWQAKVRKKGISASETFPDKEAAVEWATQTEAAIYGNTYQAKVRHTVRDLLILYSKNVLPHKKANTAEIQAAQLTWWDTQIGDIALVDLSPAHIGDALESLKGRTGATKRRYFAVITHALKYAVNDRQWIPHNPAKRVNTHALGMRESKGRTRFLSPDERAALLASCKESVQPLLYPGVVLALSTGMRAGEQFGLTWDKVDLKQGRITLTDTKNGDTRAVHVAGPALDLLRGLVRRVDNPHVFPSPRGAGPWQYRTAFECALERAKIEDFRWHDLRHSFASELAMSGATLSELADALGHKTLTMVQRYAHLGEPHMAGVVERMVGGVFKVKVP